MTKEREVSLHKDFESIKKVDEDGIEYWEGRELMPMLGYPNWAKSEELVRRAKKACVNSGQEVGDHFHQSVKMVSIGSNTMRKVNDYKLDRYACYLIVQNGDPKKPVIAMAQTYFALQTRKQEVFEITQTDEKIQKDRIRGDRVATQTHFMVGGKVRQTIKDIGGTLPEDLPPEQHIREIKNKTKKALKKDT